MSKSSKANFIRHVVRISNGMQKLCLPFVWDVMDFHSCMKLVQRTIEETCSEP